MQRGEKEEPQRRLHKSVCELNAELGLLGRIWVSRFGGEKEKLPVAAGLK